MADLYRGGSPCIPQTQKTHFASLIDVIAHPKVSIIYNVLILLEAPLFFCLFTASKRNQKAGGGLALITLVLYVKSHTLEGGLVNKSFGLSLYTVVVHEGRFQFFGGYRLCNTML